jgi:hypothetical protein
LIRLDHENFANAFDEAKAGREEAAAQQRAVRRARGLW